MATDLDLSVGEDEPNQTSVSIILTMSPVFI